MSNRSVQISRLAGILAVFLAADAVARPLCKPALTFTEVKLSEMQPPTNERKWTAIVSVDTTPCVKYSSGYFHITFRRLKENAPEIEFREEFIWRLSTVRIRIDLWADEAIEHFRISDVTDCTCAK